MSIAGREAAFVRTDFCRTCEVKRLAGHRLSLLPLVNEHATDDGARPAKRGKRGWCYSAWRARAVAPLPAPTSAYVPVSASWARRSARPGLERRLLRTPPLRESAL